MPYFVASATKANLRQAVSERMGDWWPLTSSAAGNAGGTTAVFASLIGKPTSSIDNLYLLQTGATNTGEWRPITSFDPSNGTITVARAFTAQTASAQTSELHAISPALYTLAGNEATDKTYPAVYRLVEGHYILNYGQSLIGVPRNMRDVLRIRRGGLQLIGDKFDRANSTTAPGGSWVETTGNWGVISERLYAESDADADFVTHDPDLRDGYIRATVRGELNHATTIRIPNIAFRIREDYLKAVDTTTCLLVELRNGAVDLRKNDAGTESSLATATQTTTNGVDYLVEIEYEGTMVRVWVDGVLLISHELLGTDVKYLEYPQVGVRWDKGGSPTTAARADDFYAYSLQSMVEVTNWRQTGDRVALELDTPGYSNLFHVEGRAVLTEGAADSTFEAIASDATAVYEIQTTDPSWNVLVDTAKYLLYEHLSQPGNINDSEKRKAYMEGLGLAKASADESRRRHAMPRPLSQLKTP